VTLLILILSLVNGGPDRTEVLARAKAAHEAGRFEEALALFSDAFVPESDDAGPILFNMGLAAASIGRFAEAKAYLLGARRRLRDDPVVHEALEVVNRALGRTAVQSPGGIPSFQHSRRMRLFLCGVLEILGLVLLLRFRRSRRLVFTGLLVVIAALSWGTTELIEEARAPDCLAVILKEETACLIDPVVSSGPAFRLAAGATVRVEALSDRWARITHLGASAWVPREDIALVE